MSRVSLIASVVAVAVLFVVPASYADATFTKILEPYLRVQSQLAQDTTDGVRADAEEIRKNATALAAPHGALVAQKAASLTRAADLGAARSAFGELTEVLVAYTDTNHVELPAGVEIKYCAMAKKPWFQQGSSIRNPYYGKGMLTCGEPRKRPSAP
jgi:hypothetical protein